MKKLWIKKGVMIFIFIIAALLLFSAIVMGLWNAILPAVIGVKPISFIQALGILVLSKILFGGFHGKRFRGGEHSNPWKQKMAEKCSMMTPEEREKFKSEWKTRCGGKWGMRPPADTSTAQSE
jgi:Ca2+/H+ antiporter, TMEM165/GDT1 family